MTSQVPTFPPVPAIQDQQVLPGRVALASLHSVVWGHTKRKAQFFTWATVAATIAGFVLFPPWGILVGAAVGAAVAAWIESTAQAPMHIRTMARWLFRDTNRRWFAEVGEKLPQSPSQYRAFLASPLASHVVLPRLADALKGAGDFEQARRVLEQARPTTPAEVEDVECSLFELQFVTSGDGDWARWQTAIDNLAADDMNARAQRVGIAILRAAYEHSRQRDWLRELELAWERDHPFPVSPAIPIQIVTQYAFKIGLLVVATGIGGVIGSVVGGQL